ncbi:MAG TPA: site-specific DNA-methyltransferase [Gemmataceae bacterium]|jgi:site-specific DNA-methyltransferase (adenine-specific)|nr:site-specific DNA-methyltransferase [Gemmataceae bacterium]
MEANSLFQGDCLEGFSKIKPGSVDLVFADPPFNIGYDYDIYDDRKHADYYVAWCRKWGQEIQRILKPSGTFWLAIGDDFAAELKVAFADLGFRCRSWVVWYYTFGVHCTKKFSRSHTHLFHFVKDPKAFTFNGNAIKVPSARQLVYADSRAKEGGKVPDDTWFLRPQDLKESFTPEEDVWYFPRVCGTFKERAGWHGCQMPEQLLGRIIRVSSNPGDLVLDPFAGSGTTLVVAKKLARRWLGFELSKNYADQAQARLAAIAEGDPLIGPEDPVTSAPSTAEGKRLAAPPSLIVVKPRNTRREIDRGILEAYLAAREGFSTDRVIADRDLNRDFVSLCERLGLPGMPRDWNRRLFTLRKSGRLFGLPRPRKTLISASQMDQCEFACEIAIQEFAEHSCALDNLLCDPEKADEFDRRVRSIVKTDFSSLLIRWAALRIRKRARDVRKERETVASLIGRPRTTYLAHEFDLRCVIEGPGLYWLQSADEQRKLYVGKTENLRQRFRLQIEESPFDFWGTPRRELEIRFAPAEPAILLGNQSYWIGKWHPLGNYSKLGAL